MKKIKLAIDAHRVVSDTIESSILAGYRKAFKHTDTPSEDAITESIHNYVMNDLCDLIDWDKSGGK